jgi:1-acyl-sn-glycerol-3-phosphate acyltransferase
MAPAKEVDSLRPINFIIFVRRNENIDMLYRLINPLARIAVYIFFRKIYFIHPARIPRNKPVILAVNHPTAFLEPIALAVLLRQPLYFLVRGDFFKNPLYNRLLRSLNMIPLHRLEDSGYEKAKDNFSTLEACYQGLKDNKTIMVFPEGHTVNEKRLRPIKKGLGRVALGALDRFPELEDVYIVPVGANYTYPDRPRKEIMIHFGEPFSTRDLSTENRQRSVNNFTATLTDHMSKQLIIVQNPADDLLAERLLVMNRSAYPEGILPIKSSQNRMFSAEQQITAQLNAMDEEEKEDLSDHVSTYFKALEEHQLQDYALVQELPRSLPGILLLILGFLPAQLGYYFCLLPSRTGRVIAEKKIKQIEYQIPVRMAITWMLFLLYFLFWLLASIVVGTWSIFVVALVLGVMGYFSLLYQEWRAQWRVFRRWKKLPETVKHQLLELRKMAQ